MKINWKKLLICLAIPLGVGGLSAWLTMDAMSVFEQVKQPPLSPPSLLFPVVWTLLYLLMGFGSYLIARDDRVGRRTTALTVYGIQLAFNFFWSIWFFNLQAFWFAFVWLLILWVLIGLTMVLFYRLNKKAGWCLLPYLIWVTFAGYLNFAIALLN
ncbi:MAG: tryptophan-rich sensory protein [Clostridia bacterium]|nr:tryptophan-rich sensory protein [Clostridia bacterium]